MNSEQGSVLLVSLVMLSVLTIAAIASVRMTSLEEKMTGHFRNEQLAFNAAEVALIEAEHFVMNTSFNLDNFFAGCTSGLCFRGTNSGDVGLCSNDVGKPWEDASLWINSSSHRVAAIDLDGISARAKYLIEFRCYLPKQADGLIPDVANHTDWARYFRITALATGATEDARVMLQTTIKKNDW